jgi:hypothetical protein
LFAVPVKVFGRHVPGYERGYGILAEFMARYRSEAPSRRVQGCKRENPAMRVGMFR